MLASWFIFMMFDVMTINYKLYDMTSIKIYDH